MNNEKPAVSDSQEPASNEFERAASEVTAGFFSDFWFFLRENKKWWLIPLLVVLLGLGALFLVSGTAAAPFIYALF